MKKYDKLKFIPNIIFNVILIIFLSTEIGAQQIPSLEVIANKVLKATTPTKGYTVIITQSIKASNKTNTKQAIASGLFKKTIQFNARFDLHIGLKAQKEIDNNKIKYQKMTKNQISKNKPTLVKQGSVRLIIDFSKLFKNMNEWQDVKITSVNFNNQKYLKVNAKNKSFSYILWINALNYYISKTILYVNNKKYAEVSVQYKYISNQYWLPVSLVYIQYPGGTQVTQNFSSYLFK